MAVLPTPGSPISTGLFLVRRDSTWMVRRISSSRPITGSSLPSRRRLGEVARVFLQRVVGVLGRGDVGGAALAERVDRRVEALRRDAGVGEDLAGLGVLLDRERQQQPLDGDEGVAGLLGGLLGGGRTRAPARGVEMRLAGAAARDLRQLVRARPRSRASASRGSPPARSISPAQALPGRRAAPSGGARA